MPSVKISSSCQICRKERLVKLSKLKKGKGLICASCSSRKNGAKYKPENKTISLVTYLYNKIRETELGISLEELSLGSPIQDKELILQTIEFLILNKLVIKHKTHNYYFWEETHKNKPILQILLERLEKEYKQNG